MIASTRIHLVVDRADEECVSALGACWDATRESWFINAGVELEPFAGWLPPEVQAYPHAGPQQPKGVSLSSFLSRVRSVVRSEFPEPAWVRAEVRKVSVAKSGHVYLELEERDADRQTIASTKGAIWAGRLQAIQTKFRNGTGGELVPDIKILILVRPTFHPVHGFDLVIEDIDPSFTVGDLIAKLRAIRENLTEEGVLGANKALRAPVDFVRVAVVCPAGSAGLGDFRTEADRLYATGLCRFDYFTATFQGATTSQSIRDALRSAYEAHQARPYDALAIIRGGGSVTDLAWLNDLKLARWVCRIPIPVFTGIGHERDDTILDEVAHQRFDTPSKVALHVAHAIRDNAHAALKSLDRIRIRVLQLCQQQENALACQRDRLEELTRRTLREAHQNVAGFDDAIRATARHRVREADQSLAFARERLHDEIRGVVQDGEDELRRHVTTLIHASRLAMSRRDAVLDQISQAIRHRSGFHVARARDQLEQFSRVVALEARADLDALRRDLDHERSRLERECRRTVDVATADLGCALDSVIERAAAVQRSAAERVETYARIVLGMGPGATLRRGYAIVRDPRGSPVATRAEAVQQEQLTIQFRDGDLAVTPRSPAEGDV